MINDKECDFCAPHCKTCTDKTVAGCTKCLDTAFLHIDTNICHPFCLTGYIQKAGENVCEPCHNSCVDCYDTEYDSCRICKENSEPNPKTKVINGQNVTSNVCKPIRGYYITSEYSPGVKDGTSTNTPLDLSTSITLSNSNSGIIPEFQKIEPF
jgi:hypothetical protein